MSPGLLSSLLSALEGPSRGSALAAAHFTLRPVSPGRQNAGTVFVSRLRGDDVRPGSGLDREVIRRIGWKARARGRYGSCLRAAVAGQGGNCTTSFSSALGSPMPLVPWLELTARCWWTWTGWIGTWRARDERGEDLPVPSPTLKVSWAAITVQPCEPCAGSPAPAGWSA
jgi:hypothetical protein